MSPINDNLRAPREHPTPFFRGFAIAFLAEAIGIALIFGVAYLYFVGLP